MAPLATPRDKPLQHRVQICLLLGADPVTTYLPLRDLLQLQRLNQRVHTQVPFDVGFVAEHKQRDALQRGEREEGMQFLLRDG